eukprot:gene2629-34644_t
MSVTVARRDPVLERVVALLQRHQHAFPQGRAYRADLTSSVLAAGDCSCRAPAGGPANAALSFGAQPSTGSTFGAPSLLKSPSADGRVLVARSPRAAAAAAAAAAGGQPAQRTLSVRSFEP